MRKCAFLQKAFSWWTWDSTSRPAATHQVLWTTYVRPLVRLGYTLAKGYQSPTQTKPYLNNSNHSGSSLAYRRSFFCCCFFLHGFVWISSFFPVQHFFAFLLEHYLPPPGIFAASPFLTFLFFFVQQWVCHRSFYVPHSCCRTTVRFTRTRYVHHTYSIYYYV